MYAIFFVRWMRSAITWGYVTTLEVGQDLCQTLFWGQHYWKNFSLWRKQTAHWLCSLLSGFINRLLTVRLLPLFPLSGTHYGHCCSPASFCRKHAHTNPITKMYQFFFPSFFHPKHPHKHKLHVVWPSLTGVVSPCFLCLLLKTAQGIEGSFITKPCVKPSSGIRSCW